MVYNHHMNKDIETALGETLRAVREKSGFTQTEAAEALGTTQPTISRWERGTQSPTAVDIVCAATVYQTPVASLYVPVAEENVLKILSLRERARHLEQTINKRNKPLGSERTHGNSH